MKIDPYYQRQKCSPMNLYSFWKYKVYGDIRVGSSWRRRQIAVGLSTTAIFWRFEWQLLRNLLR